MRIRLAATLAGLALASTACASSSSTPAASAPAPAAAPAAVAQPAPAAVNPVGRWTIALTAQGQAFDFVMDLRHVSGDDYSGVISSQAFPPMSTNSAKRSGNSMIIKVTAPTGDEATFNIIFEGDVLSGEWSMPGDGSRVSGRRVAQ
ncbi:MAG: hypothetical protein KF689_01550 [Gemmatimonadaceae bacterium]|nr:hypothetical protein [Gemmatimonadaceae bacterium]MCW5826614.1 hypothetical protein [Gemmatimonadaceae bacterium]